MKKIVVAFGILGSLFLCCHKTSTTNLFIRGRLFLYDTITHTNTYIPLPGQMVMLALKGGDTLDYIRSTTTDTAGYFTFSLFNGEADSFNVRFNGLIGGYSYYGSDTASPGDVQIQLVAQLNQGVLNGFAIWVVDSTGQGIPNATVRLYNNQTLAANNDSSGAIQSMQTDGYGKCFRLNIPAGVYYFDAQKTVDTLTYQRLLKKMTVGLTQITRDTLTMPRKTFVNELSVTVEDSLGEPIPFASVFVYNNKVLAMRNDSTAAIVTATTDSTGLFSKPNLRAGQYFVNALKKVDTVVYQRIAKSFVLPTAGITADTMTVFMKR